VSTRGVFEATTAERTDGSFIAVLRGSNQSAKDLPAYKWLSSAPSVDGPWTAPVPFAFTTGKPFHSSSSCSVLARSVKNGRLYWIGNMSETNPVGNAPRYPLVIAEVDEGSGQLIEATRFQIDTLDPALGDGPGLALSNFEVHQYTDRLDPRLGQFLIVLKRMDSGIPAAPPVDWYQVDVPDGRTPPGPLSIQARSGTSAPR
jgi:hypothetical protein